MRSLGRDRLPSGGRRVAVRLANTLHARDVRGDDHWHAPGQTPSDSVVLRVGLHAVETADQVRVCRGGLGAGEKARVRARVSAPRVEIPTAAALPPPALPLQAMSVSPTAKASVAT